jgi:perosamine synthetase
MSEKLAIYGGAKSFTASVGRYNSIGTEEVDAARKVVESTVLSQFLGCWDPDFYGGPKVREFEAAWAKHFKVGHAVTVNSNTSGLMAAIGAIGIEPGDEVIVSPWTMCASATSILVWNAIPVFADIEDMTFGLDPQSIEKHITPYTKAIMVTNIFGHGARLNEIMEIAKEHNLYVIEDNAQSPNALYDGRYTGTIGDIGVFSLNYHKHIHTGEGGVCVTNSGQLAERLQLIRNHAEAVVDGKGVNNLVNMMGFNFRMTEIEAAIGVEQLRKLPVLVERKRQQAERLTKGIQELVGLRLPVVEKNCSHVYCNYPILVDFSQTGISRDRIVEALQAEGVPGVGKSYENLHMLPIFQKKIAYGSNGFPWTGGIYKGNVCYDKGICPVAESMNAERYMSISLGILDFTETTIDMVIESFRKVWRYLDLLSV